MKSFITVFLILLCSYPILSQGDSTDVAIRQYDLVCSYPLESDFFSTAGVTLNKAFQDIYFRGIAGYVPDKIKPITETIWALNWSFIFTMWPHDGGHWLRASEVGGEFVIERFGYPFPVAKMHLPENLDDRYETLASIGGHEINFLMRQQIHTDYYLNQYAFADELIFGLVQDLMYPLYTFVIAYAKPSNPEVWTDTRGDPVEYTLSVYKKFTDRPAIMENGEVDPDLISQYREGTVLGLLWPMLSPMFLRGLQSFKADFKDNFGLIKGPWMIGNDRLSWSWGTHFNPSPLGYELYLMNYFRIRKTLVLVSLKYGRPYKNNGIGINVPEAISFKNFHVGLSADAWDQDIYGMGGSVLVRAGYLPQKGFGIHLGAGYKTDGYMIGRKVDASSIVRAGCSYSF
jgi:hypothetical protein